MRTPPFLLGVAVLFWGWQTGFLLVSVVLAVALEVVPWTKLRWDFSDRDFSRIWTFCALLLLVAALYSLTAHETASNLMSFFENPNWRNQRNASYSGARSMAELVRWQPMIFAPFMLASVYSSRGGVPLYTISLILQRRWRKARQVAGDAASAGSPAVSVSYPYFGLCLFASSIEPAYADAYFWGLCIMVGWALWPLRSRRFRPLAWGTALGVAIGLGYIGQIGISRLQQYIGGFNPMWLVRYSGYRFDPRHTRTMIGEVGRTKASGNIVIRLETPDGGRPPALLREASYRDYRGGAWFSSSYGARSEFIGVAPETNATSFILLPEKPVTNHVQISCYLTSGHGLLPLPRGTTRLDNLNAYIVEKNELGSVQVEGPGLLIFDTSFGPGQTIDLPPDEEVDTLLVPEREREALARVVADLGLENPTLHQAMKAIQSFFASHFTYSTWQDAPSFPTRQSALSRFLLTTRAGHCEYFATATVLLLRQMGFPARYAVGYAAHEAAGKNRYVIRQRDAHAWCLVWNNGVWLDFDTTPGGWMETEKERESPFQAFSDLWSRISYEIARVRWGQSHLREYLFWSSVPVLGLLLVQIVLGRRKRRAGKASTGPLTAWPGADSEFYDLEKFLSRKRLQRPTGQPVSEWVRRASATGEPAMHRALAEILQLHYRYRFDPRGLNSEDRIRLRQQAREWMTSARVRG